MKLIKSLILSITIAVFLTNCGGGADILSTPIENIDNTPLKENELTEQEQQTWGHLDLVKDTIPGMSVDRAYDELLKGKSGKTVIVAVIDSGIDIDHEDLDGVVWKNTKEINGNGKDDDNNGYVDDINGWNFLGDAYDEQLELTRILAKGDKTNPDYARAKQEYDEEYAQTLQIIGNIESMLQQVPPAQEMLRKHLNKSDYTKEDVAKIQTEDQALLQAKNIQMYLYQIDLTLEDLKDAAVDYTDKLNYNLGLEFKGRKTGDNIDDLTDVGYGNGNVKPSKKEEDHGTHVAGIIAAERNNGKGFNGVANNVKIMSLRVVSGGDEYDKDVALAIRYAVDNGADIINGSFGKYYSPHSDWVRDAIVYAGKNNVVIVNAAGNEGLNLDKKAVYPNDQVNNGAEISDNFITVGALAPKYGSEMVAGFSNYGKINVDVFAPGDKIYSTIPENDYKKYGGTSMAAPAVAGIAALIRSYYPKLSAAQVKQIILDSGLTIPAKVVVGGKAEDVRPFTELSKSGKMVNAYNALVMAKQLSK